MKKQVHTLICAVFVIILLLPGLPAFAASVQVSLPAFPVTLNGIQVENATRQYPLIVYKDITYFPMTFYDCGFLGLDTYYSNQTGLQISRRNKAFVPWSYNEYESVGSNPRVANAQLPAFPITVNGRTVENSQEEFPLLLYKDITYFPLTWRYAVNEFGWDYSFNETEGLVIHSFSEEEIEELLSNIYANDLHDIVGVISDNFKTSTWLDYSFRSYSRYENRLVGILSEHRPTGTMWYKEVTMTEVDDGDNTKNPKITGHYLLLSDKLYHSTDGKSWRNISASDFSFPKIPDIIALLAQLPKETYENARWDFYDGYPRLTLVFTEETPAYMPTVHEDGSTSPGAFNRHQFFIDLNGGCLRSYRASDVLFFIDDTGEMSMIAPSTTSYKIIDFNYSEFSIPKP